MERFFSALSAGNATTMVLVTTELLGFYTISTMLLLRWGSAANDGSMLQAGCLLLAAAERLGLQPAEH